MGVLCQALVACRCLREYTLEWVGRVSRVDPAAAATTTAGTQLNGTYVCLVFVSEARVDIRGILVPPVTTWLCVRLQRMGSFPTPNSQLPCKYIYW